MNNVTIEPESEIYKGCFSLKFTPKPEDKYVPKNYDENAFVMDCVCCQKGKRTRDWDIL